MSTSRVSGPAGAAVRWCQLCSIVLWMASFLLLCIMPVAEWVLILSTLEQHLHELDPPPNASSGYGSTPVAGSSSTFRGSTFSTLYSTPTSAGTRGCTHPCARPIWSLSDEEQQ
eukprot:2657949-Rhodomonas_salina.2